MKRKIIWSVFFLYFETGDLHSCRSYFQAFCQLCLNHFYDLKRRPEFCFRTPGAIGFWFLDKRATKKPEVEGVNKFEKDVMKKFKSGEKIGFCSYQKELEL